MTTVTPRGDGHTAGYTTPAAARLDDYLRQVRAALAASPDLDPGDIEADIREHVAVEFRAHTRPVSLVELERVLAALGPPAGWAAAVAPAPRPALPRFDWRAGVAAGRRVVLGTVGVLWRGPEDWRLAYLCLLFTVLGVASMGILLPVAYLLARAAVALAAEKDQPLGARAWLVYPPVVLVSLPLLLALGLWPVLLAGAFHWHAVEPAGWYREQVAAVRPDNTLVLRTEPHRYAWSAVGLNRDPAGNYWMAPAYRQQHELVLRALDRLPGPPAAAGLQLTLFAGLGLLLLWGLVVGLVGWQLPRTAAAVFFPLLSGDGRGASRLAVGCGAGFVVWVGFASRLLDAGTVWA